MERLSYNPNLDSSLRRPYDRVMSENSGEGLPKHVEQQLPTLEISTAKPVESADRPPVTRSGLRNVLTERATAIGLVAALTMPGVAFAEQADPDGDGRVGVTRTQVDVRKVDTTVLAEYKRDYGDGPDPEGELEVDAAVKAELFAREISRTALPGDQVVVRVEAQSSAEAHSEALEHGENPETSNARVQDEDIKNSPELAEDRRDNGMNLVETVVAKDLAKNGVIVSSIIPGNLSEHMWTDEQLAQVEDIAKRENYSSVYWLTEAHNTGNTTLSEEDRATVDHLLKDQRWVKLIAEIRKESTTTEVPEDPIIKSDEVAVPAYWLAPLPLKHDKPDASQSKASDYVVPVSSHDKRPREYNFGKNKQTDKRHPGRLARTKGGDQGRTSGGHNSQ